MQRLKMKDITLLTCRAYFKPNKITPYIANILKEEQLLKAALEKQGLREIPLRKLSMEALKD